MVVEWIACAHASRGMPCAAGLPLVLLASIAPKLSIAAPRVDLHYETARSDCPDEASFRARLEAALGYSPFAGPYDFAVSVAMTNRGGLPIAEIAVRYENAPETLRTIDGSSSDCATLLDAVVLSVVLVIDPLSMGVPRDPPSDSALAPPSGTSTTARIIYVPRVESDANDEASAVDILWSFRAHLAIEADWTSTPKVSPGIRMGGSIASGSFSLELDGRFVFPTSLDVGPSSAIDVGFIGAAFRPCHRWATGAVDARGCAVAILGLHRASGTGLDNAKSTSTPVVGLGARGSVVIPIAREVVLEPYLECAGSLTHTTFDVGTPAWHSAAILFSSGTEVSAGF